MANELVSLPNPTNRVGKESEGYARQNANMYAIQTGLDTCEPYDNGEGVITIPAGGVVEISGGLFVIQNDITLTKPNANAAYWIAIDDNGVNGDGVRTASAELVTRPGAWDSARQGCYRSDGRKTLNWVSLGELANLTEENMTPEMNVKGTWTKNLQKGWYYVQLASGAGGGNGGNGGNTTSSEAGVVGSAGVPTIRSIKNKLVFHDGKSDLTIKLGGSGTSGISGSPGQIYNAGSAGVYCYGGSGGGGSGDGEPSLILGLLLTESVRAGDGGNGGTASGGVEGHNVSGSGGNGGGYFGKGGTPDGITSYTAKGEQGNASGGDSGSLATDGSPGGYCRIYQLAN